MCLYVCATVCVCTCRVFGSPKVMDNGDNVMLTVATSEIITGPSRLLFPRAPGGMGEVRLYTHTHKHTHTHTKHSRLSFDRAAPEGERGMGTCAQTHIHTHT